MSDSSAAPALQIEGGNRFSFEQEYGPTRIVFYPTAPGPLRLPGGPRLEYSGTEGNLVFNGDQIRIQDSPVGTLITVILQPNPDLGTVLFTLVLPIVKGAAQGHPEAFQTIGIKTTKVGFIIQPGAQMSYSVEEMKGTAEVVQLPL